MKKITYYLICLILFSSCTSYWKEEKKDYKSLLENIENVPTSEVPLFEDSLSYAFINSLDVIADNDVVSEVIFSEKSKEGVVLKGDSLSDSLRLIIKPFTKVYLKVDSNQMNLVNDQLMSVKGKYWDLNRLGAERQNLLYKMWNIENGKLGWKEFKERGGGCFVELGLPIFNEQDNVAVIYIANICHETLANGSIYRFELVNGQWIEITRKIVWTS